MIRVILHGANGYMGRTVEQFAAEREGLTIVAGVDTAGTPSGAFPVYARTEEVQEEADVVIDFSVAAATDGLLDACAAKKLPLVLCTTGLSEAQTEKMRETAKRIPVLKSANMSLGVNVLLKLVGEIAPKLHAAGFDIEIVEKHHRRKLDAPSGTALALADAAKDALQKAEVSYVFDRSAEKRARTAEEIGISAVRGGTIVGEHDVLFAGTDEVITLSHSASSRAIFAKGALEAAAFLAGKPAGLYSMQDVIG
ncbi:MAG: 4-hydroxy-tetrahydrodipicolinate reductase [Lachnospiraceae bacterium]|nr:4-hydroxy-tetrahydrodipicolinate reductase [Lachnospiraceae bacterium]